MDLVLPFGHGGRNRKQSEGKKENYVTQHHLPRNSDGTKVRQDVENRRPVWPRGPHAHGHPSANELLGQPAPRPRTGGR